MWREAKAKHASSGSPGFSTASLLVSFILLQSKNPLVKLQHYSVIHLHILTACPEAKSFCISIYILVKTLGKAPQSPLLHTSHPRPKLHYLLPKSPSASVLTGRQIISPDATDVAIVSLPTQGGVGKCSYMG